MFGWLYMQKMNINLWTFGINFTRNTDIMWKINGFHIMQNQNVVYNTAALGGYDFEIEAHFQNSNELMEFITLLRENFPTHIKNITHMEYIKEYKVTYFPRVIEN